MRLADLADFRALGADQAITPRQALEAYTVNGAYQFGMEADAGSLDVGKLADFVILSEDPTAVDPENLDQIDDKARGRFWYWWDRLTGRRR